MERSAKTLRSRREVKRLGKERGNEIIHSSKKGLNSQPSCLYLNAVSLYNDGLRCL